MKLKDLKRYSGHMPVRMEREDTLSWIGELVGPKWLKLMWVNWRCGYHAVRYRYSDVQEAQVYQCDHGWRGIPLPVWLKLSELDRGALDGACWSWILNERKWCGESVERAVRPPSPGGVLGL